MFPAHFPRRSSEKEKWNAYYSNLPLVEEDAATERLNSELVERVSDFLPQGGRVLEAGCGGGWQSLALARTGRFEASLLDFSTEALSYAARLFEREALTAHFVEADIAAPGAPDFDLVFNAGVLEHYTFEEQVSLVRGMKSRSRHYVLVLVPNKRCYWYWVWRMFRSVRGDWPWGKEVPSGGLAKVFETAGIHFLGEAYLGEAWTESFINELACSDTVLREHILTLHRVPLLAVKTKAYLIAALGSVRPEENTPSGWFLETDRDHQNTEVLTAALADVLAIRNAESAEFARLHSIISKNELVLGSNLQQFAAERERSVQEKRALIQTIDAITAQAAELLTERRQEVIQKEDLRREVTVLREDKRLLLTRTEEIFKLASCQKESLERTLAEITEQRAVEERHIRTLQADLSESRSARDMLARESLALQDRLTEMAVGLSRKEAEVASERALSRRLGQQLEAVRSRILNAATSFEAAFQSLFDKIRRQRAWRVMVAIRKAYTLWTRQGLRGKLSTFRIPFELIAAREQGFREYDLTFPNVWDYLPDAVEPAAQDSNNISATTAVTTDKFDVIILPVFDFEFRFQRPQQVASELARSGHRVFWVSPTRFLEPGKSDLFNTVLLRNNLHEVRLSISRVNLYSDVLLAEHADEIERSLIELYRKWALAETVVIVQFPFWRQVAIGLRSRFGTRVVYDCMDDWRNWTAEPRISEFSLKEERELSRECDVLAATSAELHKRLEAETGRTALRLRNGVDYDFFRAAGENDLLAGVQHPIIGYYGAIADWVNLELMADVASMRPQYSFVIIGDVHRVDVSRLQELSNVRMLGEKHYRVIPAYLRHFDVCILPFVENQLTRAVDPVKVYEYLSQGKPVIATPIPEVRDHGELVYLAANSTDFAAQMDRALAESETMPIARMAYAESNSWRGRVECLTTAISSTFPLVSILVVSYNSREYLELFLDSVRSNTAYPHYELIIVDNNSTDGSQALLCQYEHRYPELRTLLLDRNLGFAGGNNVAAREAKGDYFVLVNADTVLTRGWLERLLRPLRADPKIGITAPVTNFSGNETRVNTQYRKLPEMEQFARERAAREFGRTLELEMAPLLCAAFPRHVWAVCGELDEKFGIGMFEDDDFCMRVKACGYRIVAVEDCFIHHFGNGSFGKLPSGDALRLFEQNRDYFEAKWNIPWTGHKLRPGVRPLNSRDHVQPHEFLAVAETTTTNQPAALVLNGLVPERTTLGQAVNRQPDGSSALVAKCDNATPGTVIRFGSALLHTAYGSAGLLSGILPTDFNAQLGKTAVTLVNDLGESNTLTFTVEMRDLKSDSLQNDHDRRN